MVESIRAVEQALGAQEKRPSRTEAPHREVVRKSLVAIKPVKKGDLFSTENLGVKRPGSGVSPMRWHEVLGQPAHRDFQPDELVDLP